MFVLTLRGWSNIVLLSSAVVATVLLLSGRAGRDPGCSEEDRPWARWMLIAFFIPLAAVAFSALLRGDYYPAPLDAPSRFWAAIPVFIVVMRLRVNVARILQVALPLALAITLGHQLLADQPRLWGEGRMSTYFADPLVFGYFSLAFGLMCLMAISREDAPLGSPWLLSMKVAGFVVGCYLSVESGSRSGWLAIPLVIALWLHFNVHVAHKRGRVVVPIAAVLIASLMAAAAYTLVPKVNTRIHEAVTDLRGYSFAGVAPDSPVGQRVTFLRIAGDLVAAHPLAGVGDTSHRDPAPMSAFPYASPVAVRTAFESAFHNQVITNTVRHGVAGGIAAALLLFLPLAIYARRLRRGDAIAQENARMGMAFGITIAVSSLTTEVVDLKYTASLYALMTALLCGSSLARHGQE